GLTLVSPACRYTTLFRSRPVDHDCIFSGAGERFRHQPWGVFGGQPGMSGRFQHVSETGETALLDVKPAGIKVTREETLVVETPRSEEHTSELQSRVDLVC